MPKEILEEVFQEALRRVNEKYPSTPLSELMARRAVGKYLRSNVWPTQMREGDLVRFYRRLAEGGGDNN